jgi:beta-barrel assembly-enhancing protease
MHLTAWIRVALLAATGLSVSASSARAEFQVPPPCKNAFTVEQEQTEGAKVAAEVFKQMPVLPDSSPISRYIQQLGAKLVAVTPGYRWPFNFHVVASEEINAFALPGGAMFVNLGTIQAAETEAQLAGVMAHELSHVVMRHSTCNMTKQQSVGTWAGLGQLGASILLGNGALGSVASQGIGMATGLGFLRMSRDYEKQADLLGVRLLHDAGYDPRGLPQFFETIQAKYGEGGAQIFSDHPNPGNRTQYVNAEIATLPPRENPKVTSPEFTRVRALAAKEKTYNAKEVQAGTWRQTGKYALVAGGPGQVIPAPPAGGTGQGAATGRLSRDSLGLSDRMVTYRGNGFEVSYPSSWQKGSGQNGSAAFVPQNGAGQSGIAYGVVIDGVKWQGGVRDANTLAQATNALAQRLSQDNGGLQQVSQLSSLSIGGRPANSVELRGRSPLSEGGTALAERDWLVTVARPDGDVNYLVFIAPEPDFATLKPVFTAMLQSFQVQ